MNTFYRFFYEFISVFFDGIVMIFKGIFGGIVQMFNFSEYAKIINSYKDSFNNKEWIFVVLAIVLLLILIGLVVILIYFLSLAKFLSTLSSFSLILFLKSFSRTEFLFSNSSN